jgi:hypothetical protein
MVPTALKILTAVPRSFGWAERQEEKPQGFGLFLQGHFVEDYWPFMHLSFRVRPKAQRSWIRRRPDLMVHQDSDRQRFFTLRPGPCDGKLVQGYNRVFDVNEPKVYMQRLGRGRARSEDEQIEALLHWNDRFTHRLDFQPLALPWRRGGAQNCNAYIAALLQKLKVPRPTRLPHGFYVPSFRRALPPEVFG